MSEKPKYLTFEFWAAILSALAMLAVTLGIATQEEASNWVALLGGLVAAVLPIVALILGYSQVRAVKVGLGLLAANEPGYLTLEFWMTIATTVAMVLVGVRVVTQEQADVWLDLLGPLVAAVLAIAAYVRGKMEIAAAGMQFALRK
jgi:hypothetical protein